MIRHLTETEKTISDASLSAIKARSVPNPGSLEATDMGCKCPILDNARGRGYLGGIKDENGDIVFVYTVGCPVHLPSTFSKALEESKG